MAIETRTIDYTHGDVLLEGFFAVDTGLTQPLPAVLVSHAWGGRDDFACDQARKLADMGYAAFALDMYGKGVLGSGPEQNAGLMQPFMADRALLRDRITAALETVRKLPQVDSRRIAAIGFCFGGLCVLDLARSGADLRGVVSVHGLFQPAALEPAAIKAKVLVLHGFDDPMATPDQAVVLARELTAAGADWQFHWFGHTLHAFTNPRANDRAFGTVYDETASRRAWQGLQAFLTEVLQFRT